MNETARLEKIPLFDGLQQSQIEATLRLVHWRQARANEVILREGERGDSLFILASGAVNVTKRLGVASAFLPDQTKEKVLIRLAAPQFFGEMALLESSERSATIVAATDCELAELSRADFERLAQADHQLGYLVIRNIANVLASRLRRTDRDVLNLTIALSLALGNR